MGSRTFYRARRCLEGVAIAAEGRGVVLEQHQEFVKVDYTISVTVGIGDQLLELRAAFLE